MTDEERRQLCKDLREYHMADCQKAADEIERLANAAIGRSLLRPANQKPTICYCKPGECSAPKPEWCIGRRYADGFREADAEPNSLREALANLVKWKNYKQEHGTDATYELGKERAWRKARAALAQSDAEPVAWLLKPNDGRPAFTTTNEDHARDYSQRHSQYSVLPLYTAPPRPDASAGMSWSGFNVYGDKKSIDAVRDALHAKDRCEALDKMIGEKQLVRPDASAGRIEAACLLDKRADEYVDVNETIKQGYRIAAKYLRVRAADRSGK